MTVTIADPVRAGLDTPDRSAGGRVRVTGDQQLPPRLEAHDVDDEHEQTDPDPDTDDDDETDDEQKPVEATRPRPPAVARRHPAGRRPSHGLTLAKAMKRVVDQVKEGVDLRAALTDVVPTPGNAPDPLGRGQWLGDLTTIATQNRDVISRIGNQVLTGMTIYGWRWGTTPAVAHYAGNKGAVPSGPVTTEAVSQPAQRYATGNDLDRIYLDLGDPGFLESYFQMCARSYADLTEADAVAALVAGGDPTSQPDLITGINMAAQMIATAGGTLRFVAIAPDLWGDLIGLNTTQAPWLFSGAADLPGITATVGGVQIFAERNVPTGKALACDSSGATWFETALLRAQVANIANGGLDVGVFGYGGLLLTEPRKIVVVTVA